MTIRKRIEQLVARRPETSKDVYVSVFDNTTEYSPENFGFFLSDYKLGEFNQNPVLDYELDAEHKGNEKLGLAFNHLRRSTTR